MIAYRHTQIGWWLIAGMFMFFPAVMLTVSGTRSIALPFAIAAVVTLLFGSLTVIVDDRRISWRFGVGVIRMSLPIRMIQSFHSVRNPWYYGWGVRLTPMGWLYNVSGLDAIELAVADGRRIRIGTDEPDALGGALQQVVVPSASRPGVMAPPPSRRTAVLVILGITAAIISAVAWSFYAGTRPPSVVVSSSSIRVHGGGFYGTDLAWSSIDEISLQDAIPRIVRKTNGFNAGNLLRGHFTLDILGDGLVFIDRGHPPYVVLKTAGSFVIVNFEDPAQTRALYDELRQRVTSK